MDSSNLRRVDVVVPVYRNLEVTRRCIESVLDNLSESLANLIVIDDASPDADVVSYCDELAQQGKVKLLRNEQNLGFVASVNLGMKLNPDNDVLLLNSDTEVSGDWLERMRTCAYMDDTTATVTPFSNNATLSSYPLFMKPNELPEGWDLKTLDQLFADINQGQRQQIPTAVGFCMYIRRDCMDKVGYFDEETFGRGYGEESDFSMRVNDIGLKNILCADVFVYHQGGVSFNAETTARITAAEDMMTIKHPGYTALVALFITEDPLRQYRDRVDIARAQQSTEDAKQVLLEARQYRDILMGNVAEYRNQRDLSVSERDKYAELLEESRDEFARTDKGLADAQSLVSEHVKALEKRDQALDQHKTLLDEARSDFARTDKGLAEAQAIVQEQNSVLAQHDQVLGQRDRALEICHQEMEKYLGDLASIENSRFWRYTKWIRDILGKL